MFLFLLSCLRTIAQYSGNSHTKTLEISNDTIRLDTLSLIPGSVQININGQLLDTSFYKIDYGSGLLILNRKKMNANGIVGDTLSSTFKSFPFLFAEETKHKDLKNIRPDNFNNNNP